MEAVDSLFVELRLTQKIRKMGVKYPEYQWD